jgi:hypothetical protein
MRLIIVTMLVAALSGCGDVVIGPVDHSCVYPNRDTGGSGCGRG